MAPVDRCRHDGVYLAGQREIACLEDILTDARPEATLSCPTGQSSAAVIARRHCDRARLVATVAGARDDFERRGR
jgi:hypothetical protein